MSRFSAPDSRALFSSRIAYEALDIESGEESEEEIVQETAQESTEEPAKLSKSAIKRAQRLARLERKQQQKEKAKAAKLQAAATSNSPAPEPHPPTSAGNAECLSDGSDGPPVHISTPKVDVKLAPTNAGLYKPPHSEPNGNGHSYPLPAVPADPVEIHDSIVPVQVESVPLSPPQVAEAQPPPHDTPSSSLTNDEPKKVPAESPAPPSSVEEDQVKKRQNVFERVVWTFIMIFGFIALLLLGHAYMVLLVMLCQTLVYREVTALFSLKTADSRENKPDLKGKDPWSKTLNWYFFAVTNYFLYGESIIYYFKHVVFADAQLLPFATNHRMISFLLYTLGFMGFVMSLKKGYLKQQFGLFCWVHMSLLIIVFSSHFIVNNILEGLIWFWVPASLVICNDSFAYIWGKTIGRTPLIKLSPKKTVEGFVGAFWSTLIFAVVWGTYFMRFNYMICPVHDLGVNVWNSLDCKPNPVFVWRSIALWHPISALLSTIIGRSITTLSYAPYQLHLLVLACFASLVAPFGGFFASGFKRAFNIKDFGHSIPGHGGITDRMDCQFLMGVFTYVYYSSLIRENNVTVGGILQTIVSGLTVEQQLELISDLTRYLEKQGIVVPR